MNDISESRFEAEVFRGFKATGSLTLGFETRP